MSFSRDFVRREARESQREQDRVMPALRDVVDRLFSGESTEPVEARADFALNGLGRRRFLTLGGVSIASAAVLAACGSDGGGGGGAAPESTTTTVIEADMRITRTASSIEHLAVKVYQLALDSQLLKTPAVADAAKLFQGHHTEHAKLFEAATTKGGGKAFTEPNPVLLLALDPAIKALTDENSVVRLALDLERMAAATYQSSVGTFFDKELNATVMQVGGIEARHVAVLLAVLKQPPVTAAFQARDGAVSPGTGV